MWIWKRFGMVTDSENNRKFEVSFIRYNDKMCKGHRIFKNLGSARKYEKQLGQTPHISGVKIMEVEEIG